MAHPEQQNPWLTGRVLRGSEYDRTYERRAAAGEDAHGEAAFVATYGPGSMLNAGCGTGRVARELAWRGMNVVGADLNPAMLETTRDKAPQLDWRLGDIATINRVRTFACAVMATNVMIFVTPGTEAPVVGNMARHLAPGGLLITGCQVIAGRLSLADYDRLTERVGLT